MGQPRWLQIVEQVGPGILMFTPLAPIAGSVIAAIKLAQTIPGATGPDKKALVQQIVATAAAGANAQAGRQVVDPTSVTVVSGQVIDSVVGVTNLIHDLPESGGSLIPDKPVILPPG